ncbi:DUF3343 domain-containing protein [bacterium]|nr:DUF3343 domain-containing protein [bacterium]QQR56130.1 MAG: DUF3343 domain-containing protein [Candidatus Melainabacteria bacterium]
MKNKRLILTFQNVHSLLAAEKCLRQNLKDLKTMRATATPQHLTDSVCSMSLEIFCIEEKDAILQVLKTENKYPSGVHLIDDE